MKRKSLILFLVALSLSFVMVACNNTFTVTFKVDGAVYGEVQTINNGDKATMPNLPTKAGYTCVGWSVEGSDEAYTKDTVVKSNLVVNAEWKANSYSIKFDANGGTGNIADQTFKYSENKALSSNTFIKEFYGFAGWATSASGEVVYTDAQQVTNLTESNGEVITLYAVWSAQAESYKVTTRTQILNANGEPSDYISNTEIIAGKKTGNVISYTPEAKTGYDCKTSAGEIVLDGGNDSEIVIVYDLREYTLTINQLFVDTVLGVTTKAFYYISNEFNATCDKTLVENDVNYSFKAFVENNVIPTNTTADITLTAKYSKVLGASPTALINEIAQNPNGDFILGADIDCASIKDKKILAEEFKASVDGDGHKLLNIAGTNPWGVLCSTFSGVLKNLYMQFTIQGNGDGSIIADTFNGEISNCVLNITANSNTKQDRLCLFTKTTATTASLNDCVIIGNGDATIAIFAFNDAGCKPQDITYKNLVYIYSNLYDNVLSGETGKSVLPDKPIYCSKASEIYVYTSFANAVTANGRQLDEAAYKTSTKANVLTNWKTSTKNLSEAMNKTNISIDVKNILINGKIVYTNN